MAVNITWTSAIVDSGSITSYRIYSSVNDNHRQSYTLVGTVDGNTFEYLDETDYSSYFGSEDTIKLRYFVEAIVGTEPNEYGASSNIVAIDYQDIALTAPVVTVDQASAGDPIDISWTAATVDVGSITSYELYRRVNAGSFTLYQTFGSGTLSYEDSDVHTNGDSLYYYVIAYAGEAFIQSNTDSVTYTEDTGGDFLLTATEPEDFAPLEVVWEPVEGALAYELFASSNGNPFIRTQTYWPEDLEAIAASQSIVSSTPLTLTSLAADLIYPKDLYFLVSGDVSGIIFTVEGFDENNDPISEEVYGDDFFDDENYSSYLYSSITSITPDSSSAETITVGFYYALPNTTVGGDFIYTDFGSVFDILTSTITAGSGSTGSSMPSSFLSDDFDPENTAPSEEQYQEPIIGFYDGSSYFGGSNIGSIDNAIHGNNQIQGLFETTNGDIIFVTKRLDDSAPNVNSLLIDGVEVAGGPYSFGGSFLNGMNPELNAQYLRYIEPTVNFNLTPAVQYDVTVNYSSRGFVDGDVMTYRVIAYTTGGTLQSNDASATWVYGTLTPPVLTASQATDGDPVSLTWTAPTPYAIYNHQIWVSIDGADAQFVDSVDGSIFAYNDTTGYSDGAELVYYIDSLSLGGSNISNTQNVTWQVKYFDTFQFAITIGVHTVFYGWNEAFPVGSLNSNTSSDVTVDIFGTNGGDYDPARMFLALSKTGSLDLFENAYKYIAVPGIGVYRIADNFSFGGDANSSFYQWETGLELPTSGTVTVTVYGDPDNSLNGVGLFQTSEAESANGWIYDNSSTTYASLGSTYGGPPNFTWSDIALAGGTGILNNNEAIVGGDIQIVVIADSQNWGSGSDQTGFIFAVVRNTSMVSTDITSITITPEGGSPVVFNTASATHSDGGNTGLGYHGRYWAWSGTSAGLSPGELFTISVVTP